MVIIQYCCRLLWTISYSFRILMLDGLESCMLDVFLQIIAFLEKVFPAWTEDF